MHRDWHQIRYDNTKRFTSYHFFLVLVALLCLPLLPTSGPLISLKYQESVRSLQYAVCSISADCQWSHLTSERLDTLLSLLLTGLGESCLVLDLGPGLGLGLEMTSGLGESCLVLDLGPGLRLGLTSDMTSAAGLGLTEGDGLMETCGEQTLTIRVRLLIQQTLEKTILREASSAGDSFLVLLFLTL